MAEIQHGLASSYNNHKCRCEPCTKAWAEYMKPRIQKYRKKVKDEEAKKKRGVNINLE